VNVSALPYQKDKVDPAAFVGGLKVVDREGDVPAWLADARRRAAGRFIASGLPTQKVEEWKFTDLRVLSQQSFVPVPAAVLSVRAVLDVLSVRLIMGPRLVFMDGWFMSEASDVSGLPDGVTVGPLSEIIGDGSDVNLSRRAFEMDEADEHSPLSDLNTALAGEGAVLRIGRGVKCSQPISIVFIGGGMENAAFHPRNLVIIEEGASAALIEHHIGAVPHAYLANQVSRIDVGAGACLIHAVVQDVPKQAYDLAASWVSVANNALYEGFFLAVGGKLSRQEISVRLLGKGAECQLSGAYLLRGEQHADMTTFIHHEVPHTSCSEVFKGVVDDRSRGVFQGRIVVCKGADKTNGHQSSKAILLSDEATVNTKPELEIYADDVKCSHGSTMGELDDASIFYMRSRGISESRARVLLIEAFVDEALDGISVECLRDAVRARSSGWLRGAK
jgi:Fe-S cluster assembly protein SufD